MPSSAARSLEEAVERAAQVAQPGEAVLLSPACASFDMFRDYRHRGEVFAAAVQSAGAVSQTYVFARSAPNAEYDRSLAWAALLLAAIGLVMVYSASIATAESSRFTGNNAAWFLARHGALPRHRARGRRSRCS